MSIGMNINMLVVVVVEEDAVVEVVVEEFQRGGKDVVLSALATVQLRNSGPGLMCFFNNVRPCSEFGIGRPTCCRKRSCHGTAAGLFDQVNVRSKSGFSTGRQTCCREL